MPRRPAYVGTGAHGAMGYDEDLTRSDVYDEEMGGGVDPYTQVDPYTSENRDFMTGGTDVGVGPQGQVTTGSVASLGVFAEAPIEEPMSDEEILAVIDAELSNCSAQYSGELAENRIAAMRYYDGDMRPAPPGRSQAVSTDVADVIEWIVPQVMDALCSSGVTSLIAESEEDELAAQLETDACEHVLHVENNGFIYLQSCVRDALLQKNGVGKVFQREKVEVSIEDYEGLTEPEVAQLLNPQDGSIVTPMQQSEYQEPSGVADPAGNPLVLYDLKVNRYTRQDGPVTDPLPPEEFLVNRDHQSILLDDARFTAHKRLPTESALISEGWDADMVRELPTYSVDETGEREERRSLEDEKDFGYDASDRAVRRIQVIECYAHIDIDRDGIAELVLVHVAGSGSYYLMGWEHVDCHPFVGTTGILLTHKFYGKSIYDRCREIQEQKTELVRQIQDNVKHQSNSRLLVVAGQVNLDDLLTSRPGGVVRQKQPGMVEPLVAPQIGELGYRHLEYLDNVRTGRAGVSPDTASVAEAIAGDTAHGLERLMSAKEELTGLMIQMFAHTLVRGTIYKIRRLLQTHRRTSMHFKARGKWQTVNPGEWRARTGANVEPGLGLGDRMKRMQALQAIGQQQAQAYADPELRGVLVTPANLYATAAAFVKATNLNDPSPFWTDPKSPEAQQVIAQRAQQAQQQQAMAAQQGAMMMQMQQEMAAQQELTKRLKIQSDQLQKQSELLFDYEKLFKDTKAKFAELELEYSRDIAGEGIENAAAQPSGAA